MITIQREAWAQVAEDVSQIYCTEHAPEVAHFLDKRRPLLRLDLYNYLAETESLDVLTVREGPTLIGYHITPVIYDMNFAEVLTGHVLQYWLRQAYRGQRLGLRLFTAAEASLKQRGVQFITSGVKSDRPYAALFRRLGWQETEMLFAKWIGD